MFSRFKKADALEARPAVAAVGSATPKAPAPAAAPARQIAPSPAAANTRAPADAVAADKEKKRKERLTELKVELHKRLLDNLNLAALEKRRRQASSRKSRPSRRKHWMKCRSP